MKFILATKQYMTQVFESDGAVYPATVLRAGPVFVTQVKTSKKDGYNAVQLGFGAKNAGNINKAQKGHMGALGNLRWLREFRVGESDMPGMEKGAKIEVSQFVSGDYVHVSGISKGKGFQGVVKRHGFAGGPRTHGQKHSEREPGAIGGGGRAGGRVVKGMRMAGRMGGDRITVKNLKVVAVETGDSLLVVKGAVPGRRDSLLEVRG